MHIFTVICYLSLGYLQWYTCTSRRAQGHPGLPYSCFRGCVWFLYVIGTALRKMAISLRTIKFLNLKWRLLQMISEILAVVSDLLWESYWSGMPNVYYFITNLFGGCTYCEVVAWSYNSQIIRTCTLRNELVWCHLKFSLISYLRFRLLVSRQVKKYLCQIWHYWNRSSYIWITAATTNLC